MTSGAHGGHSTISQSLMRGQALLDTARGAFNIISTSFVDSRVPQSAFCPELDPVVSC